jgi:hypothetical protein
LRPVHDVNISRRTFESQVFRTKKTHLQSFFETLQKPVSASGFQTADKRKAPAGAFQSRNGWCSLSGFVPESSCWFATGAATGDRRELPAI